MYSSSGASVAGGIFSDSAVRVRNARVAVEVAVAVPCVCVCVAVKVRKALSTAAVASRGSS